MEIQQWLTDKATIEKSKKNYAHFDVRTDISHCREYISDPKNIASHGFYPFIHYVKKIVKYNKDKGKREKERDICYAAHIDRCIYQLYSHILNEKYNQRINDDGLSNVVVAYRTNLGESNINFAKRAIDFIKASNDCYVMIGDFTHFFDQLDHAYLKRQWCNLLGTESLPPDQYAVFKSLTHYSMWELTDLLKMNGLENTRSNVKKLNEQYKVITPQQYKENRHQIKIHTDSFGIPQGSPLSGLLANIYMLEADKKINEVVMTCNGMYMRYSDDFIVIIPGTNIDTAKNVIGAVKTILSQTKNLILEPAKTQYFCCTPGKLTSCGELFDTKEDHPKTVLSFLGFSFDGSKASIRAKTIGKYYYRMYRKAKHIAACNGYTPQGKHISCKQLYEKYSERGMKPQSSSTQMQSHRPSGNFLSYVDRSTQIFGKDDNITRDTKRHMSKIRKALKKSK